MVTDVYTTIPIQHAKLVYMAEQLCEFLKENSQASVSITAIAGENGEKPYWHIRTADADGLDYSLTKMWESEDDEDGC